MDYQTAHNLLITQGLDADQATDTLLARLREGVPPVPGQVTSILLALKVVFEALKDSTQLDRDLAAALHLLTVNSRQQFEAGHQAGLEWPPLLNEDLERIAIAVQSIFLGEWIDY
ncbi:MAG: Dethiobiotin synthetase [Oscillatoriales cyanobacterium C42_A2020_001]|nr:Dethiobiotin synthetase [Leptolyngbyaceae cyanobacterium C42_A2020_001]